MFSHSCHFAIPAPWCFVNLSIFFSFKECTANKLLGLRLALSSGDITVKNGGLLNFELFPLKAGRVHLYRWCTCWVLKNMSVCYSYGYRFIQKLQARGGNVFRWAAGFEYKWSEDGGCVGRSDKRLNGLRCTNYLCVHRRKHEAKSLWRLCLGANLAARSDPDSSLDACVYRMALALACILPVRAVKRFHIFDVWAV